MEFNIDDLKCNKPRNLIKKGLYERSKHEVICPGCHKHITTIVAVDDKEINLSHTIVCPCGEESFKIKTTGNYVYEHEDGYCSLDIEMDKANVKLIMGVRK